MRTVKEIKADIAKDIQLMDDRRVMDMYRAEIVFGIAIDRLEEICNAEREGKCIILPSYEDTGYNGLKVKYRVFKAKNNEPVNNCFVLQPDKDYAAVVALRAYAAATDNKMLSEDIYNWVGKELPKIFAKWKNDANDCPHCTNRCTSMNESEEK